MDIYNRSKEIRNNINIPKELTDIILRYCDICPKCNMRNLNRLVIMGNNDMCNFCTIKKNNNNGIYKNGSSSSTF